MNENEIKILTYARDLIQNQGWTQNYYASTKWLKFPVPAKFKKAYNFCMIGAVIRAAKDLNIEDYRESYNILTIICQSSIVEYNSKAKSKKNIINIFNLGILSCGGKVKT